MGAATGALCAVLVLWRMIDISRVRNRVHRRGKFRALFGVGSAVAVGVSGPFVPAPSVTIPVSDVIAPAVAVTVLRRILQVRRSQLTGPAGGDPPRRLTPGEMKTLATVVRASRTSPVPVPSSETDGTPLPPDVHQLMCAVEEVAPASPPRASDCVDDWVLMVRLIGEPIVENRSGERATFGKKRSMELLAWMVLNRDRSTRSAARTAMWEADIESSTFSTIVSDLRRGLKRLSSGLETEDFAPTTYTDSLSLSRFITTDVEVLERALRTGCLGSVDDALRLVRDMPFAGTNYLWADLDGSTTRIVMTVMKAVSMAIDLASESGETETIARAVRAGLRVMPGDEDLLAAQQALLSHHRLT